MFSFFNKFMLRSLVIKSLFVLVLPLSTEFAMKECEEEDNDKKNTDTVAKFAMKEYEEDNDKKNNDTLTGRACEILPTLYTYQKEKKDIDTPKIMDGENSVEYPKLRGKNKKKKQGYNQSLSSIFCGVYNEKRSDPIFDYRCATFLFFCPLVFNSLLNFIFEIDNKPSGMFLNFFSVGWRTPLLLNFITFDIHFNWFLFAISAYFDFVYFPEKYCPRSFDELLGRNIIPLFLFSFVFDAVSLCVNFKVDDYFYITVNLSSILRTIVNGLFVISKKEEKTRMKSSCTSKTKFSVPGYGEYNKKYKDYKEDNNNNIIKKVNNKDINITGTITRSNNFNKSVEKNLVPINIAGSFNSLKIMSKKKYKNDEDSEINGGKHEKCSSDRQSGDSEGVNMRSNLEFSINGGNKIFSNMTTPGDGISSYNNDMQGNGNILLNSYVGDNLFGDNLFKEKDYFTRKKDIFDIDQLNSAQLKNLGEKVNNNTDHNENISVLHNVEVYNSLMDLKGGVINNMEREKINEYTAVPTINNNDSINNMQVNNSFNPEVKKEENIINDIEENKNKENLFEEEKSREDENSKPDESLNKSINSGSNSSQDYRYKSNFEIIKSDPKEKRRKSLDLQNGKNIVDNLIYKKIEKGENNEDEKMDLNDNIKNNDIGVLGRIYEEGANVKESENEEIFKKYENFPFVKKKKMTKKIFDD